MSNRGLAERLSISGNTIETHLRHIYAKLDVRNRQELLARLFREAYLPLFEADEVRMHR